MIDVEMLFVVAALYGAYRGIQGMGKAAGDRYRKVLSSWRFDKGGAATMPAPFAAKAGAVVATGLFGGVTAAKGFVAGWKQGWPEGRERGRDWWERRRQPHPTTETDPNGVQFCKTCDGSAIKDGAPCPDCLARQEARVAEYEGRTPTFGEGCVHIPAAAGSPERNIHVYPPGQLKAGDRCACGAMQIDGRPASPKLSDELAARRDNRIPNQSNRVKENPVAIETMTGGEVYTLEEVRAEAETIKKEAAADLEDAQADSQRACEDNTRIEIFAASLRTSQYGDYAIQHVESMSESSASRKQAADQRAAAAESRLAQVDAFLNALETPEGLRA